MSETIIHPTSIVSKEAKIGTNVKIGAFSIIEDDVEIGNNVEIRSSVVLAPGARIGNDCRIYTGAVIGTEPQDLKFEGEPTLAIIGDRTLIREYATINRGTHARGKTSIGADCMIMAYTHIAHDCLVGDNVIISNVTQLAGHVTVEDWVTFGGVAKIHQFCTIGKHSMIGADVKIVKDVPPFTLVGREPARVEGVNKIGLKRRGFPADSINEIIRFYDIVLFSGLNNTEGINRFLSTCEPVEEVQDCIRFIRESGRGIHR